MILRNHGLLTVGCIPADAFLAMFMLERACKIQVLAQAGGAELVSIPESILAGFPAQSKVVAKGLGGQLIWPGLLRKLDRIDPSYKE
jgi:ribulose-5-phosphate 4-epimerase/fuculose-1-phosphate aldolase